MIVDKQVELMQKSAKLTLPLPSMRPEITKKAIIVANELNIFLINHKLI